VAEPQAQLYDYRRKSKFLPERSLVAQCARNAAAARAEGAPDAHQATRF